MILRNGLNQALVIMVTPQDVVHGSLQIRIVMKLKLDAVSVMIYYTDITNPYT